MIDEQLVKQYLEGRELALEELIQNHLTGLYNFVFKYVHTKEEAEDVTQETFVKAWKNLKKFNPSFKFKTWLYTIGKNTALDHLKKKGLVAFSEIDELKSTDPLPEEIMSKVSDLELVGHTVAKLPLKYREVIQLYYNDQLNFREISELLSESINTIKTRHRRALAYLKKSLLEK
jgi:RNA polymerase sigma-70 factor (ECF subfamily)